MDKSGFFRSFFLITALHFLISFRCPFFTSVNRCVFRIREQFLYMIKLSSSPYYRLVLFYYGLEFWRAVLYHFGGGCPDAESQARSGCRYCFCKIVQIPMSIFINSIQNIFKFNPIKNKVTKRGIQWIWDT